MSAILFRNERSQRMEFATGEYQSSYSYSTDQMLENILKAYHQAYTYKVTGSNRSQYIVQTC